MFGMFYQFQEEGGSVDIYLELVVGMVGRIFVGDQCWIEIYIFYNIFEVIFGSCLDIFINIQCEFFLLVGQYKVWSFWFVEMWEVCFVYYLDNFVFGFVC